MNRGIEKKKDILENEIQELKKKAPEKVDVPSLDVEDAIFFTVFAVALVVTYMLNYFFMTAVLIASLGTLLYVWWVSRIAKKSILAVTFKTVFIAVIMVGILVAIMLNYLKMVEGLAVLLGSFIGLMLPGGWKDKKSIPIETLSGGVKAAIVISVVAAGIIVGQLWNSTQLSAFLAFVFGSIAAALLMLLERTKSAPTDTLLSNSKKEDYFRDKNYKQDSGHLNKDVKIIEDKEIKEDLNRTFWALADDMRERKKKGEFETYKQAYQYAERHYTIKGNTVTVKQLESNYYKAKSSGYVD